MKKLITIVLIISFACKDDHSGIDNNSIMPAPINLIVLDKNGKNLITENTNPDLIYTLDKNGKKIYFRNGAGIDLFTDTTLYKYYYSDLAVSVASVDGFKTSYLEFNGKTDTLYLDFQLNKKPSTDPRSPKYVLVEAKLNGKEWEMNTDYIPYVFIVRR